MLLTLSQDANADVRFSAVALGLCKLQSMTPEVLKTLITIATTDRRAPCLKPFKTPSPIYPKANNIWKINSKAKPIAYYELYRELMDTSPSMIRLSRCSPSRPVSLSSAPATPSLKQPPSSCNANSKKLALNTI